MPITPTIQERIEELNGRAYGERYCAWMASKNGNRRGCIESLARADGYAEEAAALRDALKGGTTNG